MMQWDLNGMCGGNRDKWFPIVYTPIMNEDSKHKVFPELNHSAVELMYNHTPIMETMLWAVFTYSVWEITNDNWEEVWMRIRMMEVAQGRTWMQSATGNDLPIKPKEVHQFVGFKINGGEETKRKFHGRVAKVMRGRIQLEMKAYKKMLLDKEKGKATSLDSADTGKGGRSYD